MAGRRDPCVIVPHSPEYALEGDDLGGAQRLAVMAVDFSRWRRRSFASVTAVLQPSRIAGHAAAARLARPRKISAASQGRFCGSADRTATPSGRVLAAIGGSKEPACTRSALARS